MSKIDPPSRGRRATNVTLPQDMVREAREFGVNLSKACEEGLRKAVAEARREAWIRENRAAMESWNAYVEKHGIPLAEYRQF